MAAPLQRDKRGYECHLSINVESHGRQVMDIAEVLVGGEGHPAGFEAGYFVKPTVFVNAKDRMPSQELHSRESLALGGS